MTPKTVLLTGAGGYLGRHLARRLLEDPGTRLILSVRPGEPATLAARQTALEQAVPGAAERARWHAGDLAAPEPFADLDPGAITAIVHGAAVTRFNVERPLAESVNRGTGKTLAFATRCPALESVTLLSSVYASGMAEGTLAEAAWDDHAGFANHYEWSKWASEDLLQRQYGALPWRIARVATVLAHDATGRVEQQNAIHNTLRLFYYGLISLLPGRAETPLFFVTGQEVVDTVHAVVTRGRDHTMVHVTPTAAETIRLGDMVELAFETFGQFEEFRRRRVPRPVLSDLESFTLLAQGLSGLGSGILAQAVDSVAPFAPQLFRHKDFETANRQALGLPGSATATGPEARSLFENTCTWLARTRWRRDTVPETQGC